MRFWSDRSFWQFAYRDHVGNPFDRSLADTTTLHPRPWVSQLHPEASQGGAARVLTQSLPAKGYDFFAPDGIGTDKDAPVPVPAILLSMDSQPDAPGATAPSLTVDGAHVVSTIETLGDQDFFKVDLVAGETYNFGEYQVVGGPNLVPLADAYLELYDSNGHLIVSADGGGPNTPEGLDALLTFTATYTGAYYLNAGAFDNAGPDGTRGDYVGDYEVFVQKVDANDPAAYHPRYTPDQPMHSIDWGTQIDRTSRNPDGDNGPRDNGAPNTGEIYNATYDIHGKNVVTYYFAKTGDIYIDEDPTTPGSTDTMIAKGMEQWEKDAFVAAMNEYAKVADIVYIEVDNRAEADFNFLTYNGTPGAGASLLGRMSPPNEENEGQGEFNAGDVRWTEAGLQQGGFYFPTLLHEMGHGHGMAHPHDNGGHSSVMPGADGGTGGLGGGFGDYRLSQQVFTVMSYNDGWQDSPDGMPSSGNVAALNADVYGWMGTLGALDIAVIQDKYGVNEDYAKGNDIYTLKDVNEAGTFFSCIWDAGGTDEIRYDGAKVANIDLRAATLKYEIGGAGWVSYAYGIHGGFTIANGVTIENATGGSGDDTLSGNDAANVLAGNDGADKIDGGAGADKLIGGAGDDTLIGGAGADQFNGGDGVDVADYSAAASGVTVYLTGKAGVSGDAAGDTLTNVENVTGSNFADKFFGNDAANFIWAHNGADSIDGGAGNDSLYGEAGDDTLTGGAGRDSLSGGDGADKLNGGADNDTLAGGTGADNLNGGDGQDTADYSASSATVVVNLQSGSVSGGDASGDVLSNIENLTGSAFGDTLYGKNSQANVLDGGAGQDILWGGTGSDTFVFKAGEANGDIVLDFAGNGASAGDSFLFEGYGLASDGAHATKLDATHLQVTSADGTHIDIITIANGALVDQSDWMFG